jgi:lysine 2,3-aminomutase
VPQYVIDAPGGGGKVPVNPEYVLSRNRGRVVLRNYEGKVFEYIEEANGAPVFKLSENFDSPKFV